MKKDLKKKDLTKIDFAFLERQDFLFNLRVPAMRSFKTYIKSILMFKDCEEAYHGN